VTAPAAGSSGSRCRTTTKTGAQCSIEARPSGLCHVHDPVLWCGELTRRGTRCAVPTGGRGPCDAHTGRSQRHGASSLQLPEPPGHAAMSLETAERVLNLPLG
jgi:hypothetical protein